MDVNSIEIRYSCSLTKPRIPIVSRKFLPFSSVTCSHSSFLTSLKIRKIVGSVGTTNDIFTWSGL